MKNVNLKVAKNAELINERIEEVKRRRQSWIKEGDLLLKWREKLGLSRAFIAQETGVDYGRITRLEHGEPVKEAKLIVQIYKMTLEKVEMHRALDILLKNIGIRE